MSIEYTVLGFVPTTFRGTMTHIKTIFLWEIFVRDWLKMKIHHRHLVKNFSDLQKVLKSIFCSAPIFDPTYLPTSGKAAKKKKRLLPKLCKPKQHFLVWLFLKTTQLLTSLCWKRLKEYWRRHKFMMCTYLPTEPAIKTMNLFKQMQRKL